MLFIDFVTLMLINMTAGLVVLAWYVARGFEDPDQPRWAPAFAVPGVIALLNGLRISWLWPLPGSYNVAYGDLSVLFGILFLGAAWSLATRRDLTPHSVFAFFAGLASLLVGVRVIMLHMTLMPLVSGLGFLLTGAAGVFAGAALRYRKSRLVRGVGVLTLLGAAAIWALNGYLGYWMHLQGFAKWMPK